MRLREKIAVVTGGSSGIGEATVRKFAEEGARVYVIDISLPPEDFRELDVEYIYCDVSNYNALHTAVEVIVEREGHIDVLFSNAGIFVEATIEDTPIEEIDDLINVNLKGTIYSLKCILPIMREQQSGSIILNSSDQCFVGKQECSIYGATKGAIGQLTKSTALDYAQHNIRVNCVCPGTVKTPLYERVIDSCIESNGSLIREDLYKASASRQPMNRIADPKEIANLVAFLASEESSFMTGSLIPIDGGYTAK